MNDRKKVYYFKKKEIPYFIAYFLMAFSNVVIANSYLFGENRYDICVFVQYISCILFIVALCTGKYKLRDLIVRGLIGIIVIFITINLRSTEFGVYSLAIIASLNIDSKRIVRFNVISNICFIVSVVLQTIRRRSYWNNYDKHIWMRQFVEVSSREKGTFSFSV